MTVRFLVVPSRVRLSLALATLAPLTAINLAAASPARAAEGEGGGFVQTNLVSDLDIARVQDDHLKNPWGIVHGPATPWWVADNNGSVSTLYDADGGKFPPAPAGPLVVGIPRPDGTPGGAPTGIVFNGVGTDFPVTDGTHSGSSLFIFATEDGTIAGWSPGVSRTQALIAVDRSKIPNEANGAVYKGLAIATTEAGQRLYASNFRAGTVDVFDSRFKPVTVAGAFMDRRIPTGFAPFGIMAAGARVYVSYAKQLQPDRHDDLKGPGNGFVDVFSTDGKLLKRLVRRGTLNSPWGMAIAPPGFSGLDGDLLIGNFGDGRINAFNPRSGEFEGALSDRSHQPIVIDGLWGIAFGNGAVAGPTNTLFFAAGINDEADGLFGRLDAVPEPEN